MKFSSFSLLLVTASAQPVIPDHRHDQEPTYVDLDASSSRNLKQPDWVDEMLDELGLEFMPGKGLSTHVISNDEMMVEDVDGVDYSLAGLEPVNIFSPTYYDLSEDGTYVTDKTTGQRIDLTVFVGKDKGADLLVSKDSIGGDVLDVDIKLKNGKMKFVHRTDEEMAVGYDEDDIDFQAMQEKYHYGELLTTEEDDGGYWSSRHHRRNLLRGDHHDDEIMPRTQRRKLQGSCNGNFQYIDVAIAHDTEFCNALGGASQASAKVQAVVARASSIYEEDMCVKVVISATDFHCSPNSDPYASLPNRGQSGCGGSGYLPEFRKYWRNNRQDVVRDVAHMFTAIDFAGGTIGCAYIGVCGSTFSGYGVNQITFTTNLQFQGVLFAHELGHNLNAQHLSLSGDFIMEPSINDGSDGFSGTSTNVILNHISAANCGGQLTPPNPSNPTNSPTPPPTTVSVTPSPTTPPTSVSATPMPTPLPTPTPTIPATPSPTPTPPTITSPVASPTGGSPSTGTCVDDFAFRDSRSFPCWVYDQGPFRCNTATTYTNSDGVDATDACCVCGGGMNVGSCADDSGWFDVVGRDCSAYGGLWCNFAEYYANSDGVTALEACCVCGGGAP